MLAYHKVNNINAKVGIYLRISLEDGDKQESNSINNQRKLIYEYLHKNNFVNMTEFIDDGATGTNFDRKGFKDLLNNIENGNINTVITKDVSRIGRNYVKTGYYIEDYFVNKGVRYISILDDIDTYTETIANELLPFKAILNDMYSKDISLKQKSSLKERKKRGRYIACYAPYGYKKNEKIVGKLEIDEVASQVVKRIFKLFLDGNGTTSIARILTLEKVPTPAMHLNMNADKNSLLYTVWKGNSVRNILRNETYLGYMIQNKEKTISHKNSKRVYLNKEDYIIIPNHHLPIISKEDFTAANEILDNNKKTCNNKKEKTLLHNFLYCNECKKRLSRRDYKGRIYYFCATRTTFHLCDNSNHISYINIENEVLKYIKEFLIKYSDKQLLRQAYISEYSKNKTKADEYIVELSTLTKELLKINNKLDTLYNDKLNNIISSDLYKKFSLPLKEEQKILNNKINTTQNMIDDEKKTLELIKNDEQKVDTIINKFFNLKNINTEVINEFIEKISIDKNRNLHVKFKFNIRIKVNFELIDFIVNI